MLSPESIHNKNIVQRGIALRRTRVMRLLSSIEAHVCERDDVSRGQLGRLFEIGIHQA